MPPAAPKLTSLCVFCGSQTGFDLVYAAEARTVAQGLAAHGAALVFGGGRIGLMGVLADTLLAARGRVVGVIPVFLRDKELAHPDATEMVIVPDMHTRKREMFERSDAFCILPGGVGTLEEMFEIITWRQLHLHNKPIIILNTQGYWDPLIALLDRMIDAGFAHRGHEQLVTVVTRAADVVPTAEAELLAPKPPVSFKVFAEKDA
jgi:uncharacterized protein (TIGR00730 family)